MEVLSTLGQIPLMFLGGLLIVLVLGILWAVAQTRSRRHIRNP